ncbi:MAG: arsenate reductase [Rhodospirillales bacterium]
MIAVHGLKNCDTCRNALKWLAAQGRDYRFSDLREDGVDKATIRRWAAAVGWERLLNRRSTTWRGLPEDAREGLDEAKALALMAAHPALVKRPVFEAGEKIVVGFGAAEREALAAYH